MSTELEFRQVIYWEQKPDVYAGEKCDEVRPRFWGYADGDMDGGFDDKIELMPDRFPAGTKIIVQVPCCPDCDQDADMCKSDDSCDFDWDGWVQNEYS